MLLSLLESLTIGVEDVPVEYEPDCAVVGHVGGKVEPLEPAELIREASLHLSLRVVQVLYPDLNRSEKGLK